MDLEEYLIERAYINMMMVAVFYRLKEKTNPVDIESAYLDGQKLVRRQRTMRLLLYRTSQIIHRL